MGVREFYANLAAHIVKKVRVRGVLVDFSTKSIKKFYNLESVNKDAYLRLQEAPNYPEVIKMLTNRQGEWKINNEGHAVTSRLSTWPISQKYGITLSNLN